MNERVDGELEAAGSHLARRLPIVAGLALAFFVLIIFGLAGGPYIFQGVTIESEVAAQLRATTGLAFSTSIPGRFDLLPRPHIVMGPSRISGPKSALTIEAEALEGDVRLLPLIVGRIELVSATLTKPRVALDLDGKPITPDSVIGRAMHVGQPQTAESERPLGIITLVDGTAAIKSKAFPGLPTFSAINVTLDWRDLDSPATLTGSLLAGKTTTDMAVWVSQPSNLMRGDHSAVAFRIHSAPIDLSANGDLINAVTTTGFRGHVSAKAPSIAGLVELLDIDTELLAPFGNFSLDSDANLVIGEDNQMTIDLPALTLRADANEYEGTLAFQGGARPTLSGTLASGQLLLAPFLSRMPAFVDDKRRWSTEKILAKKPQILDLDLRISATHLRLSPFVVDDAALAVITRGDRTEVALAGGKAYGGTTRGRFSIGATDQGVSVRGTGMLQDVDASTLSWDAFGRQLATGTLAASVNLETNGDSPAALMSNLRGWAKSTIADGEISGTDIGRSLREISRNGGESALIALRSGRTPFSKLTFDAQIADGVATIDDSAASGSDTTITLGGTADIGARSLGLIAIATPPAGAPLAAGATPPRLRFDISGWLTKPIVRPKISTH